MSALSLPEASTLLLAAVFTWAGLTKVLGPRRWSRDLQAYRLSRPFRAVGLLLVPWLELLVAAVALTGPPRWAAALVLALLAAFSIAIARARVLAGTNQLACGCFGGNATRDYRLLLLRNGLLAVPAVHVLVSEAPSEPLVDLGAGLRVGILGGLTLAATAWIWWQVALRLQERRAPVRS
jgi:uncharacterized membrane protein YphA (DoxX/SURF4 family)